MFPEGPVELYTVFLVFSSPPNLVKNLAKNLVKNLAENLVKNLVKKLVKNLAKNLVKNLANILRKIKTLVPKIAFLIFFSRVLRDSTPRIVYPSVRLSLFTFLGSGLEEDKVL